MIALVDADSIVYRIGFATEDETEEVAMNRTSSFLTEMFVALEAEDFYGYLTGKTNYRNALATTAPYKGQRKGEKPKHYQAIRDLMCSSYGFVIEEGQEADDAVGIHSTQLHREGKEHIICHIDKDLDQLPGLHFNYTRYETYEVDEHQALLAMWLQVLTGDKVDNIIGLKGIGPVKAAKILNGAKTELEMYERCVEAYDGNEERVKENASLLWLRREPGQIWEAPRKEADEAKQLCN